MKVNKEKKNEQAPEQSIEGKSVNPDSYLIIWHYSLSHGVRGEGSGCVRFEEQTLYLQRECLSQWIEYRQHWTQFGLLALMLRGDRMIYWPH